MRNAWIGLGANQGRPTKTIATALRWLDGHPGVRVEAVSELRRTRPVGPPQPDYVNGAARLGTSLSPRRLLALLQGLERAAGRRRGPRWGPRILDLDLLLYEDRCLEGSTLVLPHRELAGRRFVLEPLCDLNPDHVHPILGRTLADLLRGLST